MPARTTAPLPVPPPGRPTVRSVEVRRQGVELEIDGQVYLLDQNAIESLYYALEDYI